MCTINVSYALTTCCCLGIEREATQGIARCATYLPPARGGGDEAQERTWSQSKERISESTWFLFVLFLLCNVFSTILENSWMMLKSLTSFCGSVLVWNRFSSLSPFCWSPPKPLHKFIKPDTHCILVKSKMVDCTLSSSGTLQVELSSHLAGKLCRAAMRFLQ